MFSKFLACSAVSIYLLLAIPSPSLASANPSESALGESIYKTISEAVFLVEVLNGDGEVSAIGSAFFISDQRLITNYHVVQGGKPHLRVGSIRLECSVEKTDPGNDLALLRVPASVAAQPLKLSVTEPLSGATVFALGNPAGLERTISQGLVSGRRELNGQSLIQISAPISPGSSGGPVVNTNGEVVGVAVGYLDSGQNLNFAVPAPAVKALLQRQEASTADLTSLLEAADKLRQEMDKLSPLTIDDEWQTWNQKNDDLKALLAQAQGLAGDSPEKLLRVAEVADQAYISPIAIESARAVIAKSVKPDLRAHRILARNLQRSGYFNKDEEKIKRRTEALGHAKIVVQQSSKPSAEDLFLLAMLLEENLHPNAESFAAFQRALAAARNEQVPDLGPYLRGLFRTAATSKEAVSWFKLLVDSGKAKGFDWDNFATRLYEEKSYGLAADAWMSAAAIDNNSRYTCSAGFSYLLAERVDESLASYRKCIETATSEEGAEERLASAYSTMSSILFDRGVYDQSISYAKQSLTLAPGDAWAYHHLSKGLNALGRNGEAVAAAESAIRLSDGKFAEMHFALGSANFDLQNWDRAALAFEKAAELEPKDWRAAYNVALCMHRLKFHLDAAKWYEEVLRRNPSNPDKEEILRKIRVLRQ